MLNERTNRHAAYVLPPEDLTPWEPFARARAEYERLRAQYVTSGRTLARLEDEERPKAEADDRRRAAGILRKRPAAEHPGWPKRDSVDAAIRAERDRREALDGALADAERDLVTLVEEYRGAWLAEAEAAQEDARVALGAAVTAWQEARRLYRTRAALTYWLAEFPARSAFRANPDGGPLPPLLAQHGGPYDAAAVLTALRQDAAPAPAEPEPSPHASPVGTSWPVRGIAAVGGPGKAA